METSICASSQQASYDGYDDRPDLGDEGYDSPPAASSQAC